MRHPEEHGQPDEELQAAARLQVAEQHRGRFRLELASGDEDVSRVLALLDAAVAWLNERGITDQWGVTPFSAAPRRIAQITEWVRSGAVLFAVADEGDAACLALGSAPAYVSSPALLECYVNLLVAARGPGSRGAGGWLLESAESIGERIGAEQLRVDCYAGGDQRLVRFYEAAGFVRAETFKVDSWPGQVLSMALHEPRRMGRGRPTSWRQPASSARAASPPS